MSPSAFFSRTFGGRVRPPSGLRPEYFAEQRIGFIATRMKLIRCSFLLEDGYFHPPIFVKNRGGRGRPPTKDTEGIHATGD